MNVSVVGAGGIGGYFAGVLARAGNPVRLFARGENLEAIRSRGLEIREPGGSWTAPVLATGDPGALLPADAALVAVKSYSVASVGPVVRRLAEAGAFVLPLLNGVDAFGSLADTGVRTESLLEGLAVISSEKTAPGIITRKSDFCRVVVGERGGGVSDRARLAAEMFQEAGVDARVSEDITVDLWRKFLFLSTLAAVCGLARAPIGVVRAAPLGPDLLERAVRETAAVARARGIALPDGEEEAVLERIAALAPELQPSFLLDLERGGPNELDVLSGAISRYGRAAGISTPVHDTAVAALSAASGTRGAPLPANPTGAPGP